MPKHHVPLQLFGHMKTVQILQIDVENNDVGRRFEDLNKGLLGCLSNLDLKLVLGKGLFNSLDIVDFILNEEDRFNDLL